MSNDDRTNKTLVCHISQSAAEWEMGLGGGFSRQEGKERQGSLRSIVNRRDWNVQFSAIGTAHANKEEHVKSIPNVVWFNPLSPHTPRAILAMR